MCSNRSRMIALLALTASVAVGAPAPPPVAPVVPVAADYFGTQVTDNYRYFEDLKNPQVQAWMKGQADYARAVITPNGPPNTGELGSVKTEEGFHGLYAMSAYAHVRDGTPYPAVLLHTGANDPRVDSWIIDKMAARLEAASSSGKPILLDVDYDAGHGIGSQREQTRKLWADQMAFALWQFGDPEFQPK
jgi:protease II